MTRTAALPARTAANAFLDGRRPPRAGLARGRRCRRAVLAGAERLGGRRARALNREFFAGVDAVPLYETLLGLAAYPVVPSANAASARRPGT